MVTAHCSLHCRLFFFFWKDKLRKELDHRDIFHFFGEWHCLCPFSMDFSLILQTQFLIGCSELCLQQTSSSRSEGSITSWLKLYYLKKNLWYNFNQPHYKITTEMSTPSPFTTSTSISFHSLLF